MSHFNLSNIKNVLIVGAGHGIGFALAEELVSRLGGCHIFSTYRNPNDAQPLLDLGKNNSSNLTTICLDPTSEVDLDGLFQKISQQVNSLDLVINCVGTLYDDQHKPEKSLKQISSENLIKYFTVNSVVTPLLGKYFLPLLRKSEISLIASISAKVGSIKDNSLGGWYGYRASKAALNMFIKTMAVEFSNLKIPCISLAIHPGTTDTHLSKPYIGRSHLKVHSPKETAVNILKIIDQKELADSGRFISWDGSEIPW